MVFLTELIYSEINRNSEAVTENIEIEESRNEAETKIFSFGYKNIVSGLHEKLH